MSSNNIVSCYEDLAKKAWQRMVDLVGIHTVMILMQRAVWLAGQKYHEAEYIKFDEKGITFQELNGTEQELARDLLEEFFLSLVSTLTRLVGSEVSDKLIQEIDELPALEVQ